MRSVQENKIGCFMIAVPAEEETAAADCCCCSVDVGTGDEDRPPTNAEGTTLDADDDDGT